MQGQAQANQVAAQGQAQNTQLKSKGDIQKTALQGRVTLAAKDKERETKLADTVTKGKIDLRGKQLDAMINKREEKKESKK